MHLDLAPSFKLISTRLLTLLLIFNLTCLPSVQRAYAGFDPSSRVVKNFGKVVEILQPDVKGQGKLGSITIQDGEREFSENGNAENPYTENFVNQMHRFLTTNEISGTFLQNLAARAHTLLLCQNNLARAEQHQPT